MRLSTRSFIRLPNAVFVSLLLVFAAAHGAEAKTCAAVKMRPDENWWGLGSSFGREMPFTAKSDFTCDLRANSYGNQTQSLLVSDKGRVVYCADPVEAKISGGTIRFESDGCEPAVFENGEPIMRNLEYVFPGQGYAEVRDEFMMGDGLLVAPVVEKGVSSRSVLLPPGSWIADDGTRYKGPAKIEVIVDLMRLPYFLRENQPVPIEEEKK